MGLSRLDNFLKSVRGTILYVDPNSLDSTDSIENQGNSLTRPFKTIQRALIESARFSYQRGLNNDRFNNTTILLYPGEHLVDNRPGWIPDGANNFRLRNGSTSPDLLPYDLLTNFDLTTPDNALYKLNSIRGGVIVPRGTSIVGLDLRKTKIRPKYVPDPTNNNIERSTIFRVTGGCYFWQFSLFDSDPNGQCYVDYTSNLFVPNFSHHKLTCFEYADGTNTVNINDAFLTFSADRTDLDMYYEKISIVYGQSSGRAIEPDYPSSGLDIQAKIDEYRIVGPTGGEVGISSIKSGNGVVSTQIITLTTVGSVPGLDVDTPFRIRGITSPGYNGQFVVTEKLSDTVITYQVQNAPLDPLPNVTGSSLTLNSDTVTSASPYIFNCSLRSVYGMCGILADGDKASGFKSMVIAQFTGIGLQKDDNAFVIYNQTTGQYDDNTKPGNETISTNSRAVFKPSYRNFHVKTINDAFIQNVSIFAIGYAEHFATDTGGDQSVTNSNSNFGAKALVASGFRREAFPQDDLGYITHIIPPKEIDLGETSIEFNSIDVGTTVGIASTGNLYLYAQTNPDITPENVLEGFRFGARENDSLKVLLSSGGSSSEYSARIVMPGSNSSSQKKVNVIRTGVGINSVTGANTFNLVQPHEFINGESVRVESEDGSLPDGVNSNTIYYAITDEVDVGLSTSQIKLAKTETDAATPSNAITINEKGGYLSIVSRVSDKNSGDIGHPIQYDSTNGQWYVKVSSSSTDNTIYQTLNSLGVSNLGSATPRTYINRKLDTRKATDIIYRVRYVIPKSTGSIVARPPSDGFVIQESNTSIGSTAAEIQTYFGSGSLNNISEQRNFKFVANAEWDGSIAKIQTELPHRLQTGSQVELKNIRSTKNTVGTSNTGFNGIYTVVGVSSAKEFKVGIATDPGTFTSDTSSRNTQLPYFRKKKYNNTFYIFRNQEVQDYVENLQDGVYYLTVLNSSNKPTVAPFTEEQYSQPVKLLYPQTARDNPKSDPKETRSHASSSLVGEVVVDDVRNSITRETISRFLSDNLIGIGITDIVSSSTGIAHTVFTNIDHGLNRITRVSIANSGSGYGSGSAGDLYNARLVGFANSFTGYHATAKISINSAGNITDVKIMDGGSAYGIGNTLSIVGVATTSGFTPAVVTVSQIYNNIGDSVRISGVSSETYIGYNDLYRITDVQVGAAKSFVVTSTTSTGGNNTTGIGQTETRNAFFQLTGESIRVSSINYNHNTGIATVTTQNNHGLRVDAKVKFVGSNQSLYNGEFVVDENVGLTTFSVIIGVGTTSPVATGTIFAYREGVSSSGGVITVDNENLNGRMTPIYAGITTTLLLGIGNITSEQISIEGIENLDINIGDYLQINDEIVRVKTTVPSTPTNPIEVFRGVLGTKAQIHPISSVVRKIYVPPVELRRHSIIRASGHTFEYVGFGPGNYSTAFPDKQDRQISPEEELLAQSTRREAGINFYTGMNDKGISYSGNKKLSTITGQEEIFDTPIQTVTGEDIGNAASLNIITPIEGNFSRSIKVEGGEDGKAISEFNGPVIFSNKLTCNSSKGIEASSIYLQGNATVSRKYTVGIALPNLSGNSGDIEFYSNPDEGGYLGWVYTNQNVWRRFGAISLSGDSNTYIFDQVGIGTTTPGTLKFAVGAGSSLFAVSSTGVGIGTTSNGFKLQVNGNTNIIGTCYATNFSGDGSALTNLNASATGWTVISGGIYNTSLNNVGVGTSVPRFNLELGNVGTSNTTLHVNGRARFVGILTANDLFVSGIVTATSFNLDSVSNGRVISGILSAYNNLFVGVGGTALTSSADKIGIGTVTPRDKLDVVGNARFQTYSQNVLSSTVSSGSVTVDLSRGQYFDVTPTANVTSFVISNVPSGASTFTLKIAGGYTANLDNFVNSGGVSIPVYWPGGGVLPIVTPNASRFDVYSFTTFDGGSTWLGTVIGQNFAN
jgi:hypothetical protein